MAAPPPMQASAHRILLGVCGSVAAVKWAQLVLALSPLGEVRVIITRAAAFFVGSPTGEYDAASVTRVEELQRAGRCRVYRDEDEWGSYTTVHRDAVLHVELRKWADVLLIAPLSANSLGKLAAGLCDNLLLSVCRAWDFAAKPMLLAPAMNTCMWVHPLTARQLATVIGFGMGRVQAAESGRLGDVPGLGAETMGASLAPLVERPSSVVIIEPVVKVLACGDVGTGALAPVEDIVEHVQKLLVPRRT